MLVLTGIWLRGVDDPASSVVRFNGEQRFVADYLSTEVLGALDDERRGFLLGIAVLGHFTPELCDAALERTDSARMIDDLERAGLFVARLEHGHWSRIHPLFAEYARLALASTEPGAAARIHHNAARWLAPRWPTEAMEHAAAAGEPAMVAELLAAQHLSLIRSGAGRTLLRWARTLSDDDLIAFPEVAVAAAITSLLMSSGMMERHRYLGLAQRAIGENRTSVDGYVAAVALIASTLALEGGVTDAVDTGRRVVGVTHESFDELVDGALTAYGRALYFAGATDEARDQPHCVPWLISMWGSAHRRLSTHMQRSRWWPSSRAGSRRHEVTWTRPRASLIGSSRAAPGWVRTCLQRREPCCSRQGSRRRPAGSSPERRALLPRRPSHRAPHLAPVAAGQGVRRPGTSGRGVGDRPHRQRRSRRAARRRNPRRARGGY